MSQERETAVGLAYTLAAFLLWGLSPIFWKLIDHLPSAELVAHRVLWCALLLVPALAFKRRFRHLPEVLRGQGVFVTLLGTTFLIGCNWFIYIYAVSTDRILQASLGYYINPLITVVLGMIFLGERLTRVQWVSVGLATAGVAVLALRVGTMPWIALALAFSFGFYGLLRKNVKASPEEGLFVETGLLSPFALLFLLGFGHTEEAAFGHVDITTHVLLILTGVITLLPLVWFTHGAKRLPLSTVGILQYIAPTLQFLLAILIYREPFALPQLITFVLIWIALVLFTLDARHRWRAGRQARRASA